MGDHPNLLEGPLDVVVNHAASGEQTACSRRPLNEKSLEVDVKWFYVGLYQETLLINNGLCQFLAFFRSKELNERRFETLLGDLLVLALVGEETRNQMVLLLLGR